ncbi:hypothetical protein ACQ4PT_059757 [Festuca glaucescens]
MCLTARRPVGCERLPVVRPRRGSAPSTTVSPSATPPGGALSGSRFWSLADSDSDEDLVSDWASSSLEEVLSSPRSGPEKPSLVGFVDKALCLAGPGGTPTPCPAPARPQARSSPAAVAPSGGAAPDLAMDLENFPLLPPGSSGTARVWDQPTQVPQVLIGSLQIPLLAAGGAPPGDAGSAVTTVEGEAIGLACGEGAQVSCGPDGPWPMSLDSLGPLTPEAFPAQLAHKPNPDRAAHPAGVKWFWVPVAKTLTSLTPPHHPASTSDLRRHGLLPHPPRSRAMDRNREGRQNNKRPFDDTVSPVERRRELELRHRAERRQDLRRRDCERERSPGRWEEEPPRRFDGAGRPFHGQGGRWSQEEGEIQQSRKKKPAKKYKPRPTPPAASAPPPSVGGSSQVETLDAEPLASKSKITCYNCSLPGHYQSSCSRPPHCALCDTDGHTTGMCPAANKPTELKWYGFAIEGGAFYAFDCPPLEINPKHDNMVFVLVDASEEVINDGLKKLIDESWDFQVRKVADSEFAVQFPNADSLRLCKNATNLSLHVSKVTVVITEIRPPPKAAGKLQEVWVHLHDVPPQLLAPEHLMAAMVMLGKPQVVDELSLSKDEPVLMKFQTPVPAKLRTTVSLTVHGEIFPVRVVPDLGKGAASAAVPPPPPPGDVDDQDDEEEEETEDHNASDHNWKRQKAKSGEKFGGPSSNATSARTKTVGLLSQALSATRPKTKICKKPGHKPTSANKKKLTPCSPPQESQLANTFDQYGSNVLTMGSLLESAKGNATVIPQASTPLSKEAPSLELLASRESSPAPSPLRFTPLKAARLSVANREEVGWQSPVSWEFEDETLAERYKKIKMKKITDQASAPAQGPLVPDLLAEISASVPASKAPRSAAIAASKTSALLANTSPPLQHSKSASSKAVSLATTPTSAARRSSRGVSQGAEPVLQKAIRQAAEKENPDCHILLGSPGDNPKEIQDIVRAKELAQAAIAEAHFKGAEEKKRKASEKSVQGAGCASGTEGRAPTSSTRPVAPADTLSEDDQLMIGQMITRSKRLNVSLSSKLRVTPARQARALRKCS